MTSKRPRIRAAGVLVVLTSAALLAGCVAEVDTMEEEDLPTCAEREPGPGDLRVDVYPRQDHLEHGDWNHSTAKEVTVTPFFDNESGRYSEDASRMPPRTRALGPDDCALFTELEPGWWEVRATANPPRGGCSWYGGSGKMVQVEPQAPTTTNFQPSLAC